MMCTRSKQVISGLCRRANRLEEDLSRKTRKEKWLLLVLVCSTITHKENRIKNLYTQLGHNKL
ncbi:hypothetical protein PHJA_000119900 [Phtheirospermum japonicum]|uniref:Uncharacterized protein n=1 Tax=Phtheirospermum japonicum TaxID=374723 RepID=A0A830B5C8_9LAMI|nr:hypothetical protein PHJA_000119900 [Phtheirospermum japonicum]